MPLSMIDRSALVAAAAIGLCTNCQSGRADSGLATSTQAPPTATAGPRRVGAPMTSARFVPLATLAHEPSQHAGQPIQTEGRVTAVCQARGCWMDLVDGATQAHVRMSGHSFSIPRDASGRQARVQATVLATPRQGECEREAEQQTGNPIRLELEATGVELM